MSNETVVKTSGTGGALLLIAGVALIILKLQGIITVNWWIVLIPLYPAMLGIGILVIFFAIVLIIGVFAGVVWLGSKIFGS